MLVLHPSSSERISTALRFLAGLVANPGEEEGVCILSCEPEKQTVMVSQTQSENRQKWPRPDYLRE